MDRLYYKLDGHTPVPCETLTEWGIWFNTADRVVQKTQVDEDQLVSTVFLGLDHGYDPDHPLVFETMVFGGVSDGYQTRCSTWEQAEQEHRKVVNMLKGKGYVD